MFTISSELDIEIAVAIGEIHRLIETEANAVALLDVAHAALNGGVWVEAVDGFRSDHERHAARLARALRTFDGPAFESTTPTALGRFESVSCARESEPERLLLTLLVHERLTLAAYERRLEGEFPREARLVLEEAADDERRHLEWCREALDDVLAVQAAAAPKT